MEPGLPKVVLPALGSISSNESFCPAGASLLGMKRFEVIMGRINGNRLYVSAESFRVPEGKLQK
jgi:hypothetical protein